jgi:hypothetical protein
MSNLVMYVDNIMQRCRLVCHLMPSDAAPAAAAVSQTTSTAQKFQSLRLQRWLKSNS